MVSFTSVSLLFIIIITIQTNGISSVNPKLSKHPVMLVVSFDGFRFDYMSKTDMPTLRGLQEEGVSVPFMRSQFPTKTFPNHQSIATGLYPDVHGITDNSLYDPLHDKKLSGYNDDPEFWNYSPDVLPFWIRNEQAGDERYSGCYMWAGSSQGYGLKGNLSYPTYYIPKYNGSIPWENRVETVVSWITNKDKPANMVFLYYNQPDSCGHNFGADGPEIIEEIKKVDARIGHLVTKLKAAEIYDKINLVILSDHGMQTVIQQNIINTTTAFPVDPDAYYRNGTSPLFHIQPKKSSDTSKIYDAFKSASLVNDKYFSVYRKNELFGPLNYGSNRRIGEILILADPGYAFDDIRPNAGGMYGVHGYANPTNNNNSSPNNMSTIFIARGHAFKKGFKSRNPINNVDLFPMFSKIMGIPTAPNNGSMKVVSEFLIKTTDNNDAAAASKSSCKKVEINVLGMVLSVVYAGLC